MPYDLKKMLEKVPAEKRAAVEAALKETDVIAQELESLSTSLETEKQKAADLEKTKKTYEENWEKAKKQYDEMYADWTSTQTEREEVAKKLKDAEDKLAAMPNIDPSKVLTIEKYNEEQEKFAKGQVAYFGDALDAVANIERLTKTRVSPKTLVQEAMAAKKSPLEYAEEKYGLKAKEEELAKSEADKKDKEAEKRGYEKAVSELSNPATRTLESSKSPFLETKEGDKSKQPWELTETPKDEQDFMAELVRARVQ